MHLLTAEALRMYARKVSDDGIVLLHISNYHLDLNAVVSATSMLVPELSGFLLSDDRDDDGLAASSSDVAVLSRSKEAIAALKKIADTRDFDAYGLRAWTDDYSDILGPMLLMLED